jgi:glycine/D-amino acid oxidase-like deaminating enzyme
MTRRVKVAICGAGITGISAAYFLAKAGVKDILLIDELPPLTLTSDSSSECYRNWWPDQEMVALMNRSIDLLEQLAAESGNVFRMNRRGYLFVTADENKLHELKQEAIFASSHGAGPLRIHSNGNSPYQTAPQDGYQEQPSGADLLLNAGLIRRYYPYLTDKAVAALHVRRAGWLSAQQLGMFLFEQAVHLGVEFRRAFVKKVVVTNGRVVGINLDTEEYIDCPVFVNAAGPYLKQVGLMLGIEIPVETDLHLKIVFQDSLRVIPREAPLLIWNDSQTLPWDVEERGLLEADQETRWITELFPPGAHTRPEGAGESQTILMLWDYKTLRMEPIFPVPLDQLYPEVALRGLSTMLPRLREYFGRTPRPQVDGGYYVKTPENRLLSGPLPVEGAYVCGAGSGHGIMAACAAGELLAAHVTGANLPPYASAFSFKRYDDPEYRKKAQNWGDSGQL